MSGKARFGVGQVVHHKLFDYRGVIVDVDPICMASDQWYDAMALSRPPRNKPWYRILVHNAIHETYVAERNLESDASGEPVIHPDIDAHFDRFENGAYHSSLRTN